MLRRLLSNGSLDRTILQIFRWSFSETKDLEKGEMSAKILLLDIETAPNLAYVWGIWGENIPLARIVDAGYVLSWAAKWYGSDEIIYDSLHKSSTKKMLKGIHKLLDKADIVVHFYGKRFDIPTLNKEFIKAGMKPPSPYKQVDLHRTAKSEFKFLSNKLEYIAQFLGLKPKVKHRGFDLWKDCMADKPEAWQELKVYNCGDIETLEEVYDIMLPWISNHPNLNMWEIEPVCPVCKSTHFQKRGEAPTKEGLYHRLLCLDCGKWFRGKVKVNQAKAT
jgi:hypothetical protein